MVKFKKTPRFPPEASCKRDLKPGKQDEETRVNTMKLNRCLITLHILQVAELDQAPQDRTLSL